MRWAFDADHRTAYGLQDYVANTWEFGLDRLLTGVALSDDSSAWLDRALPLDDVGSAQVDLVGRLTEYVDRLRAATDRLTGTHPLDHWLEALDDGVASLTAVSSLDGWQPGQVQRELGRVRRAAAGLGQVDLRLPDVRALLSDRLAGRPTRANFRTGTLTVCTMVPMRSVPHRVVCLLGLDDGVFPRQGSVDGDDVLARNPLTGERDARSEDRQLLLDAILAATQTLVITYTGANEFSGQPRPPAVPLGELLDALDITASTRDGRPVSEAVTVRHPLQPFDAAQRLARWAASRARRSPSTPRRPPAPAPPPARAPAGPLPRRPARVGEPGRRTAGRPGPLLDRPGQGLPRPRRRRRRPARRRGPARGRAAGRDRQPRPVGGRRPGARRPARRTRPADVVKQREWRRGELPPGQLGWRMLGQILDARRPLHHAAAEPPGHRRPGPSTSRSTSAAAAGSWAPCPEVYGDRLVPVHYSRLGAKHRIASWVNLLALTASDDDHNWTAHTLGRPHSRVT